MPAKRLSSKDAQRIDETVHRVMWTMNGVESALKVDAPKLGELAYRNRFVEAVAEALPGARMKREAGLQARGTKIDAHIHFQAIDFLLTVKKDLTAQSSKILRGEIEEIAEHWHAQDLTFIFVHVFGCKDRHAVRHHLQTLEALEKHLYEATPFRLVLPQL